MFPVACTNFYSRVSCYFSVFSQAAKSTTSLVMLSPRNSSLIELLTEWKLKRNYHTESCYQRIDGPATSFISIHSIRGVSLTGSGEKYIISFRAKIHSFSRSFALWFCRFRNSVWISKQYYKLWMRYLCSRFPFYAWHCVSLLCLCCPLCIALAFVTLNKVAQKCA